MKPPVMKTMARVKGPAMRALRKTALMRAEMMGSGMVREMFPAPKMTGIRTTDRGRHRTMEQILVLITDQTRAPILKTMEIQMTIWKKMTR